MGERGRPVVALERISPVPDTPSPLRRRKARGPKTIRAEREAQKILDKEGIAYSATSSEDEAGRWGHGRNRNPGTHVETGADEEMPEVNPGDSVSVAERSRDGSEAGAGAGSPFVRGPIYGSTRSTHSLPVISDATREKRPRGRPPKTGAHVGVRVTKKARLAADAEEEEVRRAEAEVEAEMAAQRAACSALHPLNSVAADVEAAKGGAKTPRPPITDGMTAGAIGERVGLDLEAITAVASRSKNLKGGFVKDLKDAARSIREAFRILTSRTASGESLRLAEEVARMRAENAALRGEMAVLREEVRGARMLPPPPPPPPPPAPAQRSPRRGGGPRAAWDATNEAEERLIGRITSQVGDMMGARLDALAARLPPEPRMRPPLRHEGGGGSGAAGRAPADAAPKPQRGERERTLELFSPLPAVASTAGTGAQDSSWAQVVRKGRKGKGGGHPPAPVAGRDPAPQPPPPVGRD